MLKRSYSPVWAVVVCGVGVLLILAARGLAIGPLHTDVIVHYAWFDEVGPGGFPKRYFDFNQRHILVGPLVALAYRLFGENPVPYHLIFQASRVFEGAFLAGIVSQLTRRRVLALCAGLALMLTPLRLAELYQGINWYIEATFPLLLASTYTYLLALAHPGTRRRWLFYGLSVLCYTLSVLIYESGLPWIAVTMLAGWFRLDGDPWRARLRRVIRDAVPTLIVAGALAFATLFIFDPWNALKPTTGSEALSRLIEMMGTPLTFPRLWLDRLEVARTDGTLGLTVGAALVAGGGLALLAWRMPDDPARMPDEREDRTLARDVARDVARLLLLAVVMLLCGIMVGVSSEGLNQVFLDRITFVRAGGIALLWVTAIFGLCALLRTRWSRVVAAAVVGLGLVGPGFAWLLNYQDYAQQTRQEINAITDAALEVRRVLYAPVHLVVITPPDWPGARFPDAVDVVIHEVQQQLWERGGDATIDIIKKGNAGIAREWETRPGTCEATSNEAQAGICLRADGVQLSRWSNGGVQPYENVVVVRYDDATHTMTILPQIRLSDLDDYNITTSGPPILATNPERVAVPIE